MKQIKLRIMKKTLVPTKRQIIHQFRSDWKLVGVIDYQDSPMLIKNISGIGPLMTDAQFAKWLFLTFGEGTYYVQAFRKGREGFWSFFKVECRFDGFMRLPRKETAEDREKKENKFELRNLNRQINKAESDEEKKDLKEEVDNLKEDAEFMKEITDEEKIKVGCAPYLRSTLPVCGFHDYEDWDVEINDNNIPNIANKQKEEGGIWG